MPRVKILIDWAKIESIAAFYDSFLRQVKAPTWHGRNLDALRDSLIGGDINEIEPPYAIISTNEASTEGELQAFQLRVKSILGEAAASKRGIQFVSINKT